jgi:two-component system NarL family response regulator
MSPRTAVFLLSENRLLREALARILRKRSDISVVGAGRSEEYSFQDIAMAGAEILLLDSITSGVPDYQFVRAALQAMPHLRIMLLGMEEEEDLFLEAVRAGVVGYLLKEASAADVVTAVRGVAQGEASSPPRLCRTLFQYVAQEKEIEKEEIQVPNGMIRMRLGLTRRQQQLVPLIASGMTNKEIAMRLHLSEQTVKNHVHEILHRVGADDRLEVLEMIRVQSAQA